MNANELMYRIIDSQDYILLSLFWVMFCVLHSLLITPSVMAFFRSRTGRFFRYYRAAYNLIALITLILVLIYSQSVDSPVIFQWEEYRMLQISLIILATGIFLAGGWYYNWQEFWGILQIKLNNKLTGDTPVRPKLVTKGLLGVVRHPLYLGVLIFLWPHELSVKSLIINTILSLYIIEGTILEEQKLVAEYGDIYRDYQKRVSMLFPLKWIESIFSRSGV